MRRSLRVAAWWACSVLMAGGCAQQAQPLGEWRGVSEKAAVTTEPWSYRGATGTLIVSPNYRLYTTIANVETAKKLSQLLEAGLVQYRTIAPTVMPVGKTGEQMPAYIFADRAQWAAFTREKTGGGAKLYLQITRGGYALGDMFVAYYTADKDTWSVTAHEGFHQFCARHFTGRLPPFLEEGFATTFEVVRWRDGNPELNQKVNSLRAQQLRNVLDAKAAIPLVQLYQLDAGQVVVGNATRLTAFYSQGWAFARFLREYPANSAEPKYKAKFDRWVADTVAGSVLDRTGTHRVAGPYWDRKAVQPLIETYLQTDTATLQKEFDAWCNYLAYEEFPRQWASE